MIFSPTDFLWTCKLCSETTLLMWIMVTHASTFIFTLILSFYFGNMQHVLTHYIQLLFVMKTIRLIWYIRIMNDQIMNIHGALLKSKIDIIDKNFVFLNFNHIWRTNEEWSYLISCIVMNGRHEWKFIACKKDIKLVDVSKNLKQHRQEPIFWHAYRLLFTVKCLFKLLFV